MVFQESKGPGATEDLQELLFLGLKAKGAHQGIQVSWLLFVTVLSALDTILCQVVPGRASGTKTVKSNMQSDYATMVTPIE